MDLGIKHLEIIKGLSDISRLKIVESLKNGKLTAGEIEKAINKSQSATSQQLKKLVNSKILSSEKIGTKKYFKVRDPQIFDIIQAIDSYSTLTSISSTDSLNVDKKTVFFGLENSGKTSLMLSLAGLSTPITELKPTLKFSPLREICDDLDIKTIDPTIFEISEAGGDKSYRKKYTENPDEFGLLMFENIVYVIDIQDKKSYGKAIYNFGDIIDIFRDSESNHKIFIYLHKFDSNIMGEDGYSNKDLNAELINKLKDNIPPKFGYQIFYSSITTSNRKKLISFSK